ncbi:hypothetical protein ON010_g4875 [Phytophthora cinnamomi]|nr:hypothetical protein ON010_g4875 [Phytophthora cinnamomi]
MLSTTQEIRPPAWSQLYELGGSCGVAPRSQPTERSGTATGRRVPTKGESQEHNEALSRVERRAGPTSVRGEAQRCYPEPESEQLGGEDNSTGRTEMTGGRTLTESVVGLLWLTTLVYTSRYVYEEA